jgi:threonine dehydrogenase-like Zn-dependent dehydrogenase
MGAHYDGAWASLVRVPWYTLAPLPESVSFEHGAIACDAVSTPYAALVDRGGIRAGERVGLWGIGGLGTHAVQIARLAGASFIVAVDPLPEARDRASRLGADLVLDPADEVPSLIRRAAGGIGLDLALDLVGKTAAVRQAMQSLSRGGRLVVVGQSLETLDAGPLALLSFRSLALLGHLGYRKQHLEQVLDLLGSGRLDLSESVTATFPLESVNEGLSALSSKASAVVRNVVLPGPA